MKKIIKFTTTKVGLDGIEFIYKRNTLFIEFHELSKEVQELITSELFSSLKAWDCTIYSDSNGKMQPKTLTMEKSNENAEPIRLIDHEFRQINYITYQLGKDKVMVQRDGYIVYTAPSGGGKTYFAIHSVPMLCKNFDFVLYINLELNENDIYSKFIEYNIDIPDNLYIKRISNVDILARWSKNRGSVAFIVDNIDNLIGASLHANNQSPYDVQLEFIKQLDLLTKFNNHHALVLTQLQKDGQREIIDKDGEISSAMTYQSLSGVKQIGDQSRSVFMSAYSEKHDEYKYKILKLGSGKRVGYV